jgi:hypothetical protein
LAKRDTTGGPFSRCAGAAALGSKRKVGFQTCLQRTRCGLTPMWAAKDGGV